MHISRLHIPEEEQAAMLQDLTEMESWIHKLQEVDTTGVAPLTSVVEGHPNLREDIPATPLDHTRALTQAYEKDSNYFRVPKIKN